MASSSLSVVAATGNCSHSLSSTWHDYIPSLRLFPHQAKPRIKSTPLKSNPILNYSPVFSLSSSLINCVPDTALDSVELDKEEGEEEAAETRETEPQVCDEESDFANSAENGRLYVGNLPFSMTSSQLSEIFVEAGRVVSVEIVYDRVTDRSRGFAFVTMGSAEEAKEAIRLFDGAKAKGTYCRLFMMRSSTAADPSLPCSATSLSVPVMPNSLAKVSAVVKSGGRKLAIVRAVASNSSFGRRQLMYMATALFLLPFPNSALASADGHLLLEEIGKLLTKGKAAGLLRLVFHDAGTFDQGDNTGGMNGSIVYEPDRPENTGLAKSLKILEKAKAQVDAVRPEPVSWADMIAVAGAQAVSVCGGPKIPVQLGRIDATMPDPEGKLPEESLGAAAMKQSFQRKGFTSRELVALSGAHTLGSKGFGNPTMFDNSYYKILLDKPWSAGGMSSMIGLPSDRALVEDDECIGWISKYADDQDLFFEDFKNAYVKLVNAGAKWKI